MEGTHSLADLGGEHHIQIGVDLGAMSQALPSASWHTEVFTGPENKVPKNSTVPQAKPNFMPLSSVPLPIFLVQPNWTA